MPFSREGAERLAVALRDVTDHSERPVTVWWWDRELSKQRRGTLYGWAGCVRERVGLVVSRAFIDGRLLDDVRWVPEPYVRTRAYD